MPMVYSGGFGSSLGDCIGVSSWFRLLASDKGQGNAQPQHEFAGARLHKRSAEAGWNEFAARARPPCQSRRANN
jgi:hypothetical protein